MLAENVFVDIAILLATAMATRTQFWIGTEVDSVSKGRSLSYVWIKSEANQEEKRKVIDTMLAIHDSRSGFHPQWVDYCRKNGIPYKLVDCYASDIIEQVKDCQALLWHHSHSDPRDILIARQILFALEHAGLTVFPDFRTAWHFDDKVGQKYLFEALDIPRLPTYMFVERAPALEWAATTDYPKVFKLRHGASSSSVRIVRNERQARRLIRKAFGRGLPIYSPWNNFKERIYKWRRGESNAIDLAKGVVRFVYPPRYSRVLGRQIGYVLFQDFAPENDSDLRITVVGDKAYGVRRWVRPGDFRASGSGQTSYGPKHVPAEAVALAFRLARKLGSSCVAFDIVRKSNGELAVVEISYGFRFRGICQDFWDNQLNWHDVGFRPEYWILDLVLSDLHHRETHVRPGPLLEKN